MVQCNDIDDDVCSSPPAHLEPEPELEVQLEQPGMTIFGASLAALTSRKLKKNARRHGDQAKIERDKPLADTPAQPAQHAQPRRRSKAPSRRLSVQSEVAHAARLLRAAAALVGEDQHEAGDEARLDADVLAHEEVAAFAREVREAAARVSLRAALEQAFQASQNRLGLPIEALTVAAACIALRASQVDLAGLQRESNLQAALRSASAALRASGLALAVSASIGCTETELEALLSAAPAEGGEDVGGVEAVAVFDYEPEKESDLTLRAGDRVRILETFEDGWLRCVTVGADGEQDSQTGEVPRSFVRTEGLRESQQVVVRALKAVISDATTSPGGAAVLAAVQRGLEEALAQRAPLAELNDEEAKEEEEP